MSSAIPNACPNCGAPTIDDRCEDNCGWTYQAAAPAEASAPRRNRQGLFNRLFNPTPAKPGPAIRPAAAAAEADKPATLEGRVAQLETRIKSADQLSKYLLNHLDNTLNQRIEEQNQLLIGEAGKAVNILKPEIKQELEQLASQQIKQQTESILADELKKIDAANQESLQRIVNQQVDHQLTTAEFSAQVERGMREQFSLHFAQEFQAHLGRILLTDQDHIEIKKKIISRANERRNLSAFDKLGFWLSGASVELLQQCPEAEIKKYQALGMSMFLPIIMGLFACVHLAHQHFTDQTLASEALILTAAMVWAGFIMIIDRMLLVTYRINGDWRVKTLQFSWRFCIALLFAMIFDASFLPTLYQSDINAAIEQERAPKIAALKQAFKSLEENQYGLQTAAAPLIAQQEQNEEYARLKAELAEINANIQMYQTDRQNALNDAACEINGGPACRRGVGVKFNLAKIREEAANQRLEKAKMQKEHIEQALYRLNEKRNASAQQLSDLKLNPAYLNAKQQAEQNLQQRQLAIMASNPREETKLVFDLCRQAWADGDLFTVATFAAYLLIFVLVDTFPIIMKILMPKGLYDELLQAQDQALNPSALDADGNIVGAGFRKTELGFEITEITARFDPNKSYTAWQVIQDTLEAQLDRYIRQHWPQTNAKSGVACYTLCAGLAR